MTAPLRPWSPPSSLYLVCSLWKMFRPRTQTSSLAGYSKGPLTTSSGRGGVCSPSLASPRGNQGPFLALVSCEQEPRDDQLPWLWMGHPSISGKSVHTQPCVQAFHTEEEPKIPVRPSGAQSSWEKGVRCPAHADPCPGTLHKNSRCCRDWRLTSAECILLLRERYLTKGRNYAAKHQIRTPEPWILKITKLDPLCQTQSLKAKDSKDLRCQGRGVGSTGLFEC